MGLTDEQIQALLHKELQPKSAAVRCVQIGPLRYNETEKRCTSIRCGSPTHIRIAGIPRCTTHALYELNSLLIDYDEFDVEACTCNAGKHSRGQCHDPFCPTVAAQNVNA